MEYIKLPHLPERKVTTVILDESCHKDILNELRMNDIRTILSPGNPKISDSTKAHADMNILHLSGSRFICADYAKAYYRTQLSGAILDICPIEIHSPYPSDAALNAALIGKNMFISKNSPIEQMFENECAIKRIYVHQGYTKCNVAVVSETAIITEDKGIYKAATEIGLDVLYINPGNVTLNGYHHGFIGGACGKLASDMLAITGSLKYIPEKDVFKAFCRHHGVYITELSNKRPCDIGSILPILEA